MEFLRLESFTRVSELSKKCGEKQSRGDRGLEFKLQLVAVEAPNLKIEL